MFTGIIEGLGTIKGFQPSGEGKQMTVKADFDLEHTKIGDSIAVNGACLTAVSISGKSFSVDISPETVAKTTFANAKIGERINIERALRLSDRIDGHLVSGHIDGMGSVKNRKIHSNAIIIGFNVPEFLADYMIPKGSVAVDGVSLTVNRCDKNSFEVSIIPHTAQLTTVGLKKVGEQVNIETDMIGKYVEKFILRTKKEGMEPPSAMNTEFLAKHGFM